MLLAFLRDRDVECPLCGYNLRNLTRPVCPECMQELKLSVGVKRVRLGWFVATIAPGIFSGIAAVLLAIPIILVPFLEPKGGGPPVEIIATDIFGWLSGLFAIGLIVYRARFFRLHDSAQIKWTACMWAIHVAALVCLILSQQNW